MITTRIDGHVMPTPVNAADLEQSIVRDRELRMIRVEYPTALEFAGKAYQYLHDQWCEDHCAEVEVVIADTCGGAAVEVMRATMLLADAEWRLHECVMSCPAQDLSTGTRLISGANADIRPNTEQSVGGEEITAAPSFSLVVPRIAGTGTRTRVAYDWGEAMTHAVAAMTDGRATLDLGAYTDLPDGYAVASAYALRTDDSSSVAGIATYTFEALWLSMARTHNWWLVITGDTVRIVADADTYGSPLIDVAAPGELVQGMDGDQLYGVILVGDEQSRNNHDGTDGSVPYLPMVGMTQANIAISDRCARDMELDLTSPLIIDTNTIEGLVWEATSDRQYDRETALIQYDRGTGYAVESSFYSAQQDMYNLQMTNIEVLRRYPQAATMWMPPGLTDNSVRAGRTTPYFTPLVQYTGQAYETSGTGTPSALVHIDTGFNTGDFPNTTTPPNHDQWNSWNFGDRYVAQDNGPAGFEVHVDMSATVVAGGSYGNTPFNVWMDFDVRFQVYMPVSTHVATIRSASPVSNHIQFGNNANWPNPNPPPGPINVSHVATATINLQTGWFVEVQVVPRMVMRPNTLNWINPGFFPGYEFTMGAGSHVLVSKTITSIEVGSGELHRLRYEADTHVPTAKWAQLLANPTAAARMDWRGLPRNLYPGSITRNIITGATAMRAIASSHNAC